MPGLDRKLRPVGRILHTRHGLHARQVLQHRGERACQRNTMLQDCPLNYRARLHSQNGNCETCDACKFARVFPSASSSVCTV